MSATEAAPITVTLPLHVVRQWMITLTDPIEMELSEVHDGPAMQETAVCELRARCQNVATAIEGFIR